MTAAHFAAALAIKSRVPKAPTAALLVAAFVPDFIWIALATTGLEPTRREIFFDDWSHSLLSVVVCATIAAIAYRSRGWEVVAALWLAVTSHFMLDLPVHPKPLALYPHSSVHLGLGLSSVPSMTYWFIQSAVVIALLAVYVSSRRRLGVSTRPLVASCVLILGWHVALMPG